MEWDIGLLSHRYARIKAELHCVIDETDYRQLDRYLPHLEELARIENRSISVYDVNRGTFIIKVDKHLDLLGYATADYERDLDVDRYHAMIHPDDLPFMYDAEIRMYDFLRDKGACKKDFKLVYDYRVRSKSGTYIRFLHQMAILEYDRDFNSWLMLVISDVLDEHPKNEPPRRFIINTQNNTICLFNEEIGMTRELVTKREREVLSLIAQGLDSKTISERLFISPHTVNNHRQNILLKTRTKHIAQAVFYLKCIGIL